MRHKALRARVNLFLSICSCTLKRKARFRILADVYTFAAVKRFERPTLSHIVNHHTRSPQHVAAAHVSPADVHLPKAKVRGNTCHIERITNSSAFVYSCECSNEDQGHTPACESIPKERIWAHMRVFVHAKQHVAALTPLAIDVEHVALTACPIVLAPQQLGS